MMALLYVETTNKGKETSKMKLELFLSAKMYRNVPMHGSCLTFLFLFWAHV